MDVCVDKISSLALMVFVSMLLPPCYIKIMDTKNGIITPSATFPTIWTLPRSIT